MQLGVEFRSTAPRFITHGSTGTLLLPVLWELKQSNSVFLQPKTMVTVVLRIVVHKFIGRLT